MRTFGAFHGMLSGISGQTKRSGAFGAIAEDIHGIVKIAASCFSRGIEGQTPLHEAGCLEIDLIFLAPFQNASGHGAKQDPDVQRENQNTETCSRDQNGGAFGQKTAHHKLCHHQKADGKQQKFMKVIKSVSSVHESI